MNRAVQYLRRLSQDPPSSQSVYFSRIGIFIVHNVFLLLVIYCCNKASNRIVTRSKELVFYSWIPLSPEMSRLSPFTYAQQHTRTSRTFYTFAVHQPKPPTIITLYSQWVVAQCGDRAIRLIMDWLKRNKDDHRTLDQYLTYHVPDAECCICAARQKDFVLRCNLLYLRVTPKKSNEDVLVFVVPGLKRQAAIDGCHRYLGHQGRDRTLSLLKERFWWPGMAQRMMMSVRNCSKCHIFEAKPQIPLMEPILCTEPLDLVHIDYVSMEVTVGVTKKPVVKNVLVVEDHFTHFTQAYVTNNHTACTMARILYNEFFLVFGSPRQLMSDQASEFTGQVISELCDLLGVTKIRTSPYHPQTNGAIERVHQTLRRMIAKMVPEKRAKWPSHLGPILIAYNATRSLVTGYLPYFLMFGHRPRLPVDLLFLTVRRDENSRTTDEYVTSLYDKLKSALASARDIALLEAQRQKRLYDRRAGAVELHPGDKVLVKLDAFRGQRRKLKNRWGDALYTVVKCVADGIPAYEVENDMNKKRQVLHWS